MHSDSRCATEALRFGLLAGYHSPGDVAAWADGLIAAETTPHPALLELALCRSRPVPEVVALLAQFPNPCPRAVMLREAFADMLAALREEPSRGGHMARLLDQLLRQGQLSEAEVGGEVSLLNDHYAAERAGTMPEGAALSTLTGFLERNAADVEA